MPVSTIVPSSATSAAAEALEEAWRACADAHRAWVATLPGVPDDGVCDCGKSLAHCGWIVEEGAAAWHRFKGCEDGVYNAEADGSDHVHFFDRQLRCLLCRAAFRLDPELDIEWV